MRRLSDIELGELRARAAIETALAESQKVAAAAKISFWSRYATEPPPGMVWGAQNNGEIELIPEAWLPSAAGSEPSPQVGT